MKRFLFLINYYNDVDHTASLITEMLDNGHAVSLLCLTQYSIQNDIRIRKLSEAKHFKIHKFCLLPRNAGTSNQKTGAVSIHKKVFREFVVQMD